MTRLDWGNGPRTFEQGVDQGVLYLSGTAVPWNGLVSVDEKATGYVDAEHYYDGVRIHISQEAGDFEAKLSAFTYPSVFNEYNGWGEREEYQRFGFCYRTQHGSGHRLHLVYNVLVRDTLRQWSTISERGAASLFEWDIYAASEEVPDARPSSRLVMEAPRDPQVLEAIEDILYGTDSTEPRLPPPAEVLELYEAATMLRITRNGDGSYTASGPDTMVRDLGDGSFEIESPSAEFLNRDIFTVHSY